MKLKITGDYRDVANSAWISTMSEVKAASRTDQDALRVVKFLIENHHTSPLESVTLTLEYDDEDSREIIDTGGTAYFENKWARVSGSKCTLDLLNFIKITRDNNLFEKAPWLLFCEARPELSSMCQMMGGLEEKNFTSPPVDEILGSHGMSVELVSLHRESELSLSRATWRLKMPLSIATQALRHRKGSFNAVSGRYRTIYQEVIPPVDDCSQIAQKIGLDLSEYLDSTNIIIERYEGAMSSAKKAKEDGLISNDEYKRFREFARFILPEGRMTEMYVTFYLDDFYNNYLPLRNSTHAQTEHIWISQQMQRTLEEYSRD
jgi:thymidylate synthase ThyX